MTSWNEHYTGTPDHTHSDYADGFDAGKEHVLITVRLAVKQLDEAARLRDLGDIGARVLEDRVREMLRDTCGVSVSPDDTFPCHTPTKGNPS